MSLSLLSTIIPAFCPHRQAYVGFSHDAFDKNVIIEEFKKVGMRAAENATDEDNLEDDEEDNVAVTTRPNHRHVYDLIDYVNYLTLWKSQVEPNQFFPVTTYQDVCWTSLGLVALAMTYLPKFPGHAIVQKKSGSDKAEEAFCYKRGMNANADKLGTDQILASCFGGPMTSLFASKKANFKKRKTFYGHEIQFGKFKRARID